MRVARAAIPLLSLAAALASCESAPETFGTRATAAGRAAAMAVDGTILMGHVRGLVAVRATEVPVTPAWYSRPHTSTASANYMAEQFRALGLTPVIDRAEANDIVTENVYADIPGTTRPSELVLLTGHHDAWFSGADDNASAMAVILEAARVLRDAHPDRTIRLLAFDYEEYGLIGSQRYLTAHPTDHVSIVLNMDCVAYARHEEDTQMAPPGLQAPTVGDFLAAVANGPATGELQRFIDLGHTLGGNPSIVGISGSGNVHTAATADFLRSDHAPFWRAGIPGLFLTDTANFRNPNYHEATDTADTLDVPFFTGAAREIVAATVAYATVD